MRIVDVWESREAHDKFAEGRLNPAIAAVLGGQVETRTSFEVHEVHSLVKPLGTRRAAVG
jgi:hypothetical protein